MVVPFKFEPRHHGVDGFGDVPDFVKSKPNIQKENAINAIVRLAHEYKGS